MKIMTLERKLSYAAWFIDPGSLQSLRKTVDSLPEASHGDDLEDFFSLFVNQRPPLAIDSNGIAVITISGVLASDVSRIESLMGLTDYSVIESEVAQVMEAGVKAVLFDMDSPGGESQGAGECAAVIAEIDVPTASFTSGMDCSAAFYLSSSVDRKFVTPSSFTGSIGTIFPWVDSSKMFDMFGLSWEPITGQGEDFKGAGAGPSLTADQREYFQEQANQSSAAFRDHVSNYRDVPFKKLKGGAFLGKQAVELNLADRIGSFDQAYNYLKNKT